MQYGTELIRSQEQAGGILFVVATDRLVVEAQRTGNVLREATWRERADGLTVGIHLGVGRRTVDELLP